MTQARSGVQQVAPARAVDALREEFLPVDTKPVIGANSLASAGNAAPLGQALVRSEQLERNAPCRAGCACGTDVRGWIAVIAQRRKIGLSVREAVMEAWDMVTAVNPFPATLGRICPHPCEVDCNRGGKDGPVAIRALERFLGDWGLRQRLPLPRLEQSARRESIGVIGAGPAGLSFAYQMARRGYRVTVYEKERKPGGMLYHGIPQYRLPEEVLDAEIRRIVDLGVELELGFAVGSAVAVRQLRDRHDALFLGIGAGRGVKLGIPGEEGPGVWTGTDYLSRLNRGEPVDLGTEVVIVGGGNTAMDAARCARRTGANVTTLYRRTRREMPAIASEVDEALAEGVRIEYLAAPVAIVRDGGEVRSVLVQKMQLGEPDDSGRRRPVPSPGSEHELPATAVIAAVSQVPDWDGLEEIAPGTVRPSAAGELRDGLWTGGNTLGSGIAGMAIAQGRHAAEALHAKLRGLARTAATQLPVVPATSVKPEYYAGKQRAAVPERAVEQRLAQGELEVQETIGEDAFLEEVSRCFSCGSCFDCEHCFMYCNAGSFARLAQAGPGTYFSLNLDRCEACGKCIELCPCGFLAARQPDLPAAPQP